MTRLTARRDADVPHRDRDALVVGHMALARRIAGRYHTGAEPFDDLVQVANLALVKAAGRYEASRGASFTSYAGPSIAGEIKRHFRDNGWSAHVPRGPQERALRIRNARLALTDANGREPTVADLVQHTKLEQSDVVDGLVAYAAMNATSLEMPAGGGEQDGDSTTLTLADTRLGVRDPGYTLAEARVDVRPAVQRLTRQERGVLRMRFVEDRTQADIATRLGVSQTQVSRILQRIVERVRSVMDSGALGEPSLV